MPKDTTKDLTQATALAAAGMGIAAATSQEAIAASLMQLFPPLIGAVLPGWLQRKQQEAREWWKEVLGSSGSDEGVAAEIETKLQSPDVQDIIFAALRSLFERVAPETRTPLALLTREYARGEREPDWYFRAVAKLLTDVTSEEYVALKQLVLKTAGSRLANPQRSASTPSPEPTTLPQSLP